MDRKRRRQRVHLLQQTQQIAFFKQSIELCMINQLLYDSRTFSRMIVSV